MAAITSLYNFTKDPLDVLDYTFNWAQWLNGDTITAFTASPSPGIIVNSAPFTATATTVYLSGGTAGKPYEVTHQIVTASGRTKNLTMTIRVREQ